MKTIREPSRMVAKETRGGFLAVDSCEWQARGLPVYEALRSPSHQAMVILPPLFALVSSHFHPLLHGEAAWRTQPWQYRQRLLNQTAVTLCAGALGRCYGGECQFCHHRLSHEHLGSWVGSNGVEAGAPQHFPGSSASRSWRASASERGWK